MNARMEIKKIKYNIWTILHYQCHNPGFRMIFDYHFRIILQTVTHPVF